MNERVCTSIKLYEKCSVPRRQGEGCPLFVNVIKNNITSSVIYIIACLSKTR